MNRRDIVIGLLIFAVIAALLFWRNRQQGDELKVPEEEVASSSTEQQLEEKFNTEIPDDAEKAELKDVSGGDGTAIATRKVIDGKTEVAVLADLPDPESGKVYQVWLQKDKENRVALGGMRIAKGGWLIEQTSNQELTDYKTVLITLEENRDNTPEKTVLSGDF